MNETCTPRDDCGGHIECVLVDGFVQVQCLDGWTGDGCVERNFTGDVDPECPTFADGTPISTDGCTQDRGTCFNNTCCCQPG